MSIKKKVIKYAVDKAKRSKLIQSVFEQPMDLQSMPKIGSFVDSTGHEHIMYGGLRSKLKPGWENVFNQEAASFDKSPQAVQNIVNYGNLSFDRIEPLINIYAGGIKGKKVLDIGCNHGGTSFVFAEKGASQVVGTEFSGYKIDAVDNTQEKTESSLQEVNQGLKDLREEVSKKFQNKERVSFADDDICNTSLEKNQFDLISSWDVLEHLHDPEKSMKSMYDLLKPGGYAIHEYNPFFSAIGGHSASTIDFMWGHVLLNNKDFEKFCHEKQPERAKKAISFYQNGLNRMTIHGLQEAAEKANLEFITMIRFPKEQYLRMVDEFILKRAQENYPSLDLNDLINYKILVVLKKSE